YYCGWPGIEKVTCLKRGCKWDDHSDPIASFCYLEEGKGRLARVEISTFGVGAKIIEFFRVGIAAICEHKHSHARRKRLHHECIFINTFSTVLPEGLCPAAPFQRKKCGCDDITREECLNRVCCWDDTLPNATKCFEEP
ncbi:unnamed protein product, partial [Porites lobata]